MSGPERRREDREDVVLKVVNATKSNLMEVIGDARSWAKARGVWVFALEAYNRSRMMTAEDLLEGQRKAAIPKPSVKKEEAEDQSREAKDVSEPEELPSFIEVKKREAGRLPDLIVLDEEQQGGILSANQDLNMVERKLMEEMRVYLDPLSGRAEAPELERKRHRFDRMLRKAFHLHKVLIENVDHGNIHGLFKAMMAGSEKTKVSLYVELGKLYDVTMGERHGVNGLVGDITSIAQECDRLGMKLPDEFLLGCMLSHALVGPPSYKELATGFMRVDNTDSYREVIAEFTNMEGHLKERHSYRDEWRNVRRPAREHARRATERASTKGWTKAKDDQGEDCCILQMLRGKCTRKKCKFSHEQPTIGWRRAKEQYQNACFNCGSKEHMARECPSKKAQVEQAKAAREVGKSSKEREAREKETAALDEYVRYLDELDDELESPRQEKGKMARVRRRREKAMMMRETSGKKVEFCLDTGCSSGCVPRDAIPKGARLVEDDTELETVDGAINTTHRVSLQATVCDDNGATLPATLGIRDAVVIESGPGLLSASKMFEQKISQVYDHKTNAAY